LPHAGFGFERTLAHVTGLSNVRDAIPSREPPAKQGIEAHYTLAIAFVLVDGGGRAFSEARPAEIDKDIVALDGAQLARRTTSVIVVCSLSPLAKRSRKITADARKTAARAQ
jgi:hypothetical protein